MTRETQGLRESRDLDIDVDVLANLWAAAPFPRLPSDAPSELKKLTVDIEDPKRVYAIHHASRRHNVQALVERQVCLLAPTDVHTTDIAKVYSADPLWMPEQCVCHSYMLLMSQASCCWCAGPQIQCDKCQDIGCISGFFGQSRAGTLS